MLHEVLFALLGHVGSIIIEVPVASGMGFENHLDEGSVRYIVNPNLTFLSRAEIEQLNRVVRIGALYRQIK